MLNAIGARLTANCSVLY